MPELTQAQFLLAIRKIQTVTVYNELVETRKHMWKEAEVYVTHKRQLQTLGERRMTAAEIHETVSAVAENHAQHDEADLDYLFDTLMNAHDHRKKQIADLDKHIVGAFQRLELQDQYIEIQKKWIVDAIIQLLVG